MNYYKIYCNVIDRAILRDTEPKYGEKHHIIPKCLGGTDIKDNIVKLTYKEHYLAHLLLAKWLGHKYDKLWCAVYLMAKTTKKQSYLNVLYYEDSKSKHRDIVIKTNKKRRGKRLTQEMKDKIRRTCTGQKRTEQTIENIRKAQLGSKKSKEARQNMSKARKGKYKGKDNIKFMGYWITPNGMFESAKLAGEANNCSASTVRLRCHSNNKEWFIQRTTEEEDNNE